MNRCKDCKHMEDPFPGRPFAVCNRIPHVDALKDTDIAYVQDADDYSASLRVTGEFGCVLWKAKS